MKKSLVVALVAVALLMMAAAWGQEGTPNVRTAETWQGPTVWQGGARTFKGSGNTIWSLGIRGEVNHRKEASLTFVSMDVAGHDPIGGGGASMSAVRASDLHALCLECKTRISRPNARRSVALAPAVEFCTRGPRGTNTATGGYAEEDQPLISLGMPISWGGRTIWTLEPKVVWFDSSIPDSTERSALARPRVECSSSRVTM